jgi:hypothetical protein
MAQIVDLSTVRTDPIYSSPPEAALQVLETTNFSLKSGHVNVSDETILSHVRHSIRLGHPQVRMQQLQLDRIALVGSGPSLAQTEPELVALLRDPSVKLVTMNGAYQWALAHNLRPSAQIILDARATNARFLDPAIPACRYLLASQCHPDTFAAAAGRDVWIFHAAGPDSALKDLLDTFYLKKWHGVVGGTTVFTRALALLRMLGFLRFDVFGVDSCWMGEEHHALPQPENETDKRYTVEVTAAEATIGRRFVCSPWHMKQAEDFLQFVRVNGSQFLLHLHGDGLLAYMLEAGAETLTATQEHP